jgi:hypothetical protein
MIPASMSVSNAVNSERSIVHHQAAKRVRSRRETIETSSGTALDQWCLAFVDGGLTGRPEKAWKRVELRRQEEINARG